MNTMAMLVAILVIMELVLLPLYVRFKRKKYKPWLKRVIKCTMTLMSFCLCFVAILKLRGEQGGWFNLSLDNGFETNILVAIGMFVCAIADVALTINFEMGAALFLAGHICYISYFLTLAEPQYISIVLIAIPGFLAYKFFSRYTKGMGKKAIGFFVYGITILGTFSLGVLLPYSLGSFGWLPAIASMLLVVSDYMLAINKFVKNNLLDDIIYLGFYFSGQYVMALSVFVPVFLGLS